jgi:hypothetical protein
MPAGTKHMVEMKNYMAAGTKHMVEMKNYMAAGTKHMVEMKNYMAAITYCNLNILTLSQLNTLSSQGFASNPAHEWHKPNNAM